MKSVKLSSKRIQIKLLGCANFGAMGSIGRVSKSIPVHLKTGVILSGSDDYNVISNSTIQITIVLQHTLIQAL